jgi:hypothetical protein
MARKKLNWWQKHWDEVVLVVFVGGGLILMLFALGVF